MRRYDSSRDRNIVQVANRMHELAERGHESVSSEFNEVYIVVRPGMAPESVVDTYWQKRSAREAARRHRPSDRRLFTLVWVTVVGIYAAMLLPITLIAVYRDPFVLDTWWVRAVVITGVIVMVLAGAALLRHIGRRMSGK